MRQSPHLPFLLIKAFLSLSSFESASPFFLSFLYRCSLVHLVLFSPSPPLAIMSSLADQSILESIINTIIERGSSYFFFGFRTWQLPDGVLLENFLHLTPDEVGAFYAYICTRPFRRMSVRYIRDRLSENSVQLLRDMFRSEQGLPAGIKTRLVIAVLVGFVASCSQSSFYSYCESLTSPWNACVAHVISHEEVPSRCLNIDHVSLANFHGPDLLFDFGSLRLFAHGLISIDLDRYQPEPIERRF